MPPLRAVTVALASMFVTAAHAADDWEEGCKKASTEVLCAGLASSCQVQILDRGMAVKNNAEGGYAECKAFAKKVKEVGVSLQAKKTLKTIETELAKATAELKKDFPFLKITADLKNLELAAMVVNARAMASDKNARSFDEINSVYPESHFATRFIKNPKNALYAIGTDAEMRELLKSKLSEIRFTFESHRLNAWMPTVRAEGTVMLIPGIDSTRDGFCDEYCIRKFIDQEL